MVLVALVFQRAAMLMLWCLSLVVPMFLAVCVCWSVFAASCKLHGSCVVMLLHAASLHVASLKDSCSRLVGGLKPFQKY